MWLRNTVLSVCVGVSLILSPDSVIRNILHGICNHVGSYFVAVERYILCVLMERLYVRPYIGIYNPYYICKVYVLLSHLYIHVRSVMYGYAIPILFCFNFVVRKSKFSQHIT